MKEKIYGVDVSHYQKGKSIQYLSQSLMDKKGKSIDFIMAKATEGATWIDGSFNSWMETAKQQGILKGAYHYARPENNSPEEEGSNFLDTVNDYIGECVLALDWEGLALKYDAKWALAWLDYVYNETGVRPLFYVQYSAQHNYNLIRLNNYGFWIAKYGTEPKCSMAMWQFTSTPIDMDVFYGNRQQLEMYMKSDKVDRFGYKCPHCGYEW